MEPANYVSYAREKLGQFLDVWEGPGPAKGRLLRGWMYGPNQVIPGYLPDGLRQEFEALNEALNWVPPGPETAGDEYPGGNFRSTIEVMSDEEAEAIADRIKELHASLDPRS